MYHVIRVFALHPDDTSSLLVTQRKIRLYNMPRQWMWLLTKYYNSIVSREVCIWPLGIVIFIEELYISESKAQIDGSFVI